MATLSRDPESKERDPAAMPLELRAAAEPAFTAEFDRLRKEALQYARKTMKLDETSAREVVLVAFEELWKTSYAVGIAPREPVAGTLFSIVHYRAIDWHRKTARQRRREEDPAIVAEITDHLYDREEAEPEPDRGALLEQLRALLPLLPPKARRAVQAVDIQGMGIEAAAEMLDVSPDTVRSHRTRGRALLRKLFMRDGFPVVGPTRGRPKGKSHE